MNYNDKYIKYKIKYNNLKKTIKKTIKKNGGSSQFLQYYSKFTNDKIKQTASYIYYRDGDGVFYFALARKVPYGARPDNKRNTGAAGTNKKYHGKWGTLGGSIGGVNKKLWHHAIDEINEEADMNIRYSEVDIKNVRRGKLSLKSFISWKTVGLFLFEYNDKNGKEFFKFFPKFPSKRGGRRLVKSSKGEIDYVSSFTMKQLVKFQNKERNQYKNNFIISYVINSFNKFVIPEIYRLNISKTLYKWLNTLKPITNNNQRIILPLPNYSRSGRNTRYRKNTVITNNKQYIPIILRILPFLRRLYNLPLKIIFS